MPTPPPDWHYTQPCPQRSRRPNTVRRSLLDVPREVLDSSRRIQPPRTPIVFARSNSRTVCDRSLATGTLSPDPTPTSRRVS